MSCQPIAALIKDLQQHNLLNETLVIWGAESGRIPLLQGDRTTGAGRGSSPRRILRLAGRRGIRGGITVGETDELGCFPVAEAVHDIHATVLHLLGIDPTKLTYKFQGRQFRLTDMRSNLVTQLLA